MGELEIPYWRGEYRVESGASDTSRRKMGVPTPSPRGRGLEKPDNRIPWASIKYLIGEVRTERDVGGGALLFVGKGVCPPPPGRGLESPDKRIPWASLKYQIGEVSTEWGVGAIAVRGKGMCARPPSLTLSLF